MIELLTISLSIYALSTLLTAYEGLGGVFTYLRTLKPLESLLTCPVCTGFWIALPFLLIFNPLTVLAGYGLFMLVVRNE